MEMFAFLTVNTINLSSFLMFVFRVHNLFWSTIFGWIALGCAIPAFILGGYEYSLHRPFFFWFPAITYGIWGILDLFLDYVLKIEFRNPVKPSILAPFLFLFYFGIGGMAFRFWKINFAFWLISGITCALNCVGAVYAALHGKG